MAHCFVFPQKMAATKSTFCTNKIRPSTSEEELYGINHRESSRKDLV